MRRKYIFGLIISLLIIGAVFPVALSMFPPKIDLKSSTISVGARDARGNRSGMLQIRNIGFGIWRIKRVMSSCGCLNAAISNVQVFPFCKTEIRVSATPKDGKGRIDESLAIESNDRQHPMRIIEIKGGDDVRLGFAVRRITAAIGAREDSILVPIIGFDKAHGLNRYKIQSSNKCFSGGLECDAQGQFFAKLNYNDTSASGLVRAKIILTDEVNVAVDQCDVLVIVKGGAVARPNSILLSESATIEIFKNRDGTQLPIGSVVIESEDIQPYLDVQIEEQKRVKFNVAKNIPRNLLGSARIKTDVEDVIVPIALLSSERLK